MNHSVEICELPADRLEQAWPLVREIAGAVSLENWCAFARAILDPNAVRRGILIAQRKRTIRGLVTYEAVDQLARKRVLLLRNAIVLDIALGEAIASSLFRGCLDIARQAQCDGFCVEVSRPMAWIGEIWQRDAMAEGGMPMRIVDTPEPDTDTLAGRIISVGDA